MCFFFVLFVRQLNWYSNDTGHHFTRMMNGLKLPIHAFNGQTKNLDSPIFAGLLMTEVILQQS